MAKRLVFSIDSMSLVLLRTDPPQLHITAHGYASSTGWTNPTLELIDEKTELSPDGVLDFNFKAEPPSSVSLPVITPITASFTWTKDATKVIAVRIVARTNEKTELVRSGVFTTFVLGEEMQQWPRWPKLPIPEQPPKPPWIREVPPTGWFGEHWPRPWPPSDPRGEGPFDPFNPDDPLINPGDRGPFGGGGFGGGGFGR